MSFFAFFKSNFTAIDYPVGLQLLAIVHPIARSSFSEFGLFLKFARPCYACKNTKKSSSPRLFNGICVFVYLARKMVKNKGRKVAKRPCNRRLSILERGIAMGMSASGDNNYTIANHLNCTTKTVRELKKKVKVTKLLDDRKRTGRPKKTSPREDRAIKFNSLQDRFLTASAMCKKIVPTIVKNQITPRTVRTRLIKAGLPARVPQETKA
jgi:hypothetical protein